MRFQYVALDRTGAKFKGTLEANDQGHALETLKREGLFCLKIKPIKPSIWKEDLRVLLGKPVKHREFVAFCRQMAALIRTGTTIADALQLLKEQVESKSFKEVLDSVYREVQAGQPLSEACQQYPRYFPSLFQHMVKAGELAGRLDDVLDDLARYYEKEYVLREKVKSALTYPALVSVFSLFVVIFLLVYVIPQLIGGLIQSGSSIPAPTAFVMALSELTRRFWFILLALCLIIPLLWRLLIRRPQWHWHQDRLKLNLPVFGVLITKTAIGRLARTLGSLLSSAVPILQALSIVEQVVGNEVLAKALREAQQSVSRGESLSQTLAKHDAFPPLVIHMLKVGETTGQLDEMLQKLADFYDDDVDHLSSRLSAVLEPILIIILAVVVGGIVLAALLPIFEIYRSV